MIIKLFKTCDWVIQTILLVYLFLFIGMNAGHRSFLSLTGYYLLCGWQVFSCLVHLLTGRDQRNPFRQVFQWMLLLFGMWYWLSRREPIYVWGSYVLLYPFMGLFYCRVCYMETKNSEYEK